MKKEQKEAIIAVGRACDLKCNREIIRFVYSDGKFVYGTNSHIMLVAKAAVPKGFYEPNGNPSNIDLKPLEYRKVIPDYKKYIQPLHSRSDFFQVRGGYTKCEVFENWAGGNFYYYINTRFLRKAKAFVGNDFKVFADPESGREPVVFEGKDRLAVVMPMSF